MQNVGKCPNQPCVSVPKYFMKFITSNFFQKINKT